MFHVLCALAHMFYFPCIILLLLVSPFPPFLLLLSLSPSPFSSLFSSLNRWGFPVPATTIATASALIGLCGAFADLAVPTPTVSMPTHFLGVRMPPFHVDDNFVVPVFSAFMAVKIFEALKLPVAVRLSKLLIFKS